MTKQVHDVLGVEDLKVEVIPQIIDNTIVISASHATRKPRGKVKARVAKAKVAAKRSRLEGIMGHLYDLEDNVDPDKPLNVDLGLYQMENF